MTFTKRELMLRIWENVGGSQQVVKRTVQAFMDEIIDELARGNRVEFRDFGTFRAVRKPPRRARNPRTGQQVQVAARTKIVFKAGRRMKKKAQAVKE